LKTNGTSLEVPFFPRHRPRAEGGVRELFAMIRGPASARSEGVDLGFRNTSSSFGSVTKALHWTIATFFLLSYCSAYYSIWFTVDGTVANDIAVQIYITSGILVAGLILVRIY